MSYLDRKTNYNDTSIKTKAINYALAETVLPKPGTYMARKFPEGTVTWYSANFWPSATAYPKSSLINYEF